MTARKKTTAKATTARQSQRLVRTPKKEWVPIKQMRVRTGISQRKLNLSRVSKMQSEFNEEYFGIPHVNKVGEFYFVVDGQHRVEAYKGWIGDWEKQKVECFVYYDLSIGEEARLFDGLNNSPAVRAFDKFSIRRTGGYEEEVIIDATVRKVGLKIEEGGGPGTICCVTALVAAQRRQALKPTLVLIQKSYGETALKLTLVDGFSRWINRYNGLIDNDRAAVLLERAGYKRLRQNAERIHDSFGGTKGDSIAAAARDIYNRGIGKSNKKLASWWESKEKEGESRSTSKT